MDSEIVLELPTDVRSIEHAVEYVLRQCPRSDCHPHRMSLNFRVGLTEALANAMLYGNGYDPTKRVRVEIDVDDGGITARITDQGNGFDPAAVPDPTEPENLLKPGGRGLFLMRKLLDEVSFNAEGNCVTLVLRFDSGTSLEGGAPA
jgi:serine/threonine-protein kinase RsbW